MSVRNFTLTSIKKPVLLFSLMKSKLHTLYKRHFHIIPGVKSYVLATIFVVIFGLTVTIFSWYVDKQRIDNQKETLLVEQAASVQDDIRNRLSIYEQILRGASGLFRASDSVTSDEWQQYIKEYNAQQNYPGSAGIGFIQYLTDDQLPGYVEMMRAQGLEVTLTPAGQRPDYGLITYLEPLTDTGRKAIGYDVLTDKNRVGPANKARDTGNVGISDKLVLLGDVGKSNEPGFAMYIPVYTKDTDLSTVEARRKSLRGFVFASYRAKTFFAQSINQNKFRAYHAVEIFDGNSTDNKNLLYKSKDYDSFDQSKVSRTFTTKVFERPWTIRFVGQVPTSTQDKQRSNMILIGGTTVSLAIAGFLFLVMLTRARAIAYAKQNEAQQAKDDLLSLASHQLRTPATAVKQYLGMILEGYTGEIDPQQLPALQKAYASNERQLETINQILYVAKADAGRLSINKNTFDLNLLIDDIVLDLEDTLEENDQTIKIERSRKKLLVYADEASIRMVVENLISNASKYSYSGSKITVKTGLNTNDEAYVAVTDRGVGIADEDFSRLFQKFSRIDNERSLQVGGSGIGLYIDKVLIELHDGHIDVTSDVGKGSTFTIYLPKTSEDNLTDDSNNNGPV